MNYICHFFSILLLTWFQPNDTPEANSTVTIEIVSPERTHLNSVLEIYDDGELVVSYESEGVIRTKIPIKDYSFRLLHCEQEYIFKASIYQNKQHVVLVIEEGDCQKLKMEEPLMI
ncbi:hypothetical protein V6R21_12050 [Limibacter armeniacum]|uniref:hypothetical protein n=1 Tax=Limibacter armeniacum TaxID=466084 RepID=UPI002FE50C79